MIHPRCRLKVETIRLPLPEKGAPVGSEPRVVVLVGSAELRLGGYLICVVGQRECWPSVTLLTSHSTHADKEQLATD